MTNLFFKSISLQTEKVVYKHLNADLWQYPRIIVSWWFVLLVVCAVAGSPTTPASVMEMHNKTQSKSIYLCERLGTG